MSTTLAVAALLATLLASISFLAGTTCTNRATYRQLVKERQKLNAMRCRNLDSYTPSPYYTPSTPR
jgi:hypothetical protein